MTPCACQQPMTTVIRRLEWMELLVFGAMRREGSLVCVCPPTKPPWQRSIWIVTAALDLARINAGRKAAR